MKRVGGFALLCVSLAATPAVAQEPESIHIRAWIDGRSHLILDDDTAFWQHFDFAAPGRLECQLGATVEPTYLEGVAWYPEWPDVPTCENRGCTCSSDTFVGLSVSLPNGTFQPVTVLNEARGPCAIVENPSAANGYRVVIEFNDNSIGGAAWYDVDLLLEQCEVTNYCTSTVNSSGQAATIDVVGDLSVVANDMRLIASGCPPDSRGLFFFGWQPVQMPFANGYLCVSPIDPGLIRVSAVTIRPTGHAQAALDLTRLPPYGTITAGSRAYFQLWFRDLAAGGAGSNLSDALEVVFCP